MSFDGGIPHTRHGGGAGHDTPTNPGTTTGPAADLPIDDTDPDRRTAANIAMVATLRFMAHHEPGPEGHAKVKPSQIKGLVFFSAIDVLRQQQRHDVR